MGKSALLSDAVPEVASAPAVAAIPLVLHRRPIVRLLATIILALTLLSLAGQISKFFLGHPTVFGLVEFLYVDLENNLPTWYQSVSLLFAAALLAAIGMTARQAGAAFAVHWLCLAAIFLFLSLDETASLHERAIEPLQRLIGRPAGVWAPTWIFLGMAQVVAVGLFFLRFLLHLEWHMRLRLVAAAALFVVGSIGFEMLAAGAGGDKATFSYVLTAHVEELLEMAGVLVLIDALLRRLEGTRPFQIEFSG